MLPRHSSGTVERFLADRSEDANSGAALHAKAGILFEAATRLGVRYRASTRHPFPVGYLLRQKNPFHRWYLAERH